jgi:hypothetical protein
VKFTVHWDIPIHAKRKQVGNENYVTHILKKRGQLWARVLKTLLLVYHTCHTNPIQPYPDLVLRIAGVFHAILCVVPVRNSVFVVTTKRGSNQDRVVNKGKPSVNS